MIALVRVENTTALNLCDVILQQLDKLNLSLDCVVGQCFDGASNMAGQYSGVQARLKEVCPRQPVYIHCWAHVLNLVLQDVVKGVQLCSKTFDLLQKIYVVIEGSPKRHAQYLACVSDLNLDDGPGPQILQSLSTTRWAARCTNLRIVRRCLPAVIEYLSTQSDTDSRGLLKGISEFEFIFGVEFLHEVFVLANATSVALQANDTDLAAAAIAVDGFKQALTALRSDREYDRLYEAAALCCSKLGICPIDKRKRKKAALPASLKGCVMESYLTKSSDALASSMMSESDRCKLGLKVDYFLPVLDMAMSALSTRFNSDCMHIITHMPSVLRLNDDFDNAVRQLSKIAKLDADLCVAEGKQVLTNAVYKSADTVSSLHSMVTTMTSLKHSMVYKNFYNLLVFLLTLPVTSASCERAHSKVDLIKSAVRASMTSERLEDLVLISAEKTVLDSVELSSVINSFAACNRGLPL